MAMLETFERVAHCVHFEKKRINVVNGLVWTALGAIQFYFSWVFHVNVSKELTVSLIASPVLNMNETVSVMPHVKCLTIAVLTIVIHVPIIT